MIFRVRACKRPRISASISSLLFLPSPPPSTLHSTPRSTTNVIASTHTHVRISICAVCPKLNSNKTPGECATTSTTTIFSRAAHRAHKHTYGHKTNGATLLPLLLSTLPHATASSSPHHLCAPPHCIHPWRALRLGAYILIKSNLYKGARASRRKVGGNWDGGEQAAVLGAPAQLLRLHPGPHRAYARTMCTLH